MARTMHTRTPSAGPRRNGKSRRRRRRGRKSRTISYTSKKGTGSAIPFRSRKLNGRKYRSILWRDSILKTKYRTNFAFTQGQATPANSAQFSVGLYDAFGNTASPPWTTGGGTLAQDFGTAVPVFSGDIIVRGGVLGIRVTNQAADSQPQEVKVFLMMTPKRTTTGAALAPPAISNQPVGFELNQLTDFSSIYGTILMSKTALLENSNVVSFTYRMRTHKIDQFEYAQAAKRFYWIVAVGGTESATASTATITQFWNASFVGDSF